MSIHDGNHETRKWRIIAHAALGVLAFVALLAIVDYWRGHQSTRDTPPPDQNVTATVERISFSDLKGWQNDSVSDALPPFLISCRAMAARDDKALFNPVGTDRHFQAVYGYVADWRPICTQAETLDITDHESIRTFLEQNFVPFKIHQPNASSPTPPQSLTHVGLFTGYFEPIYSASAVQTDRFNTPVLSRPKDLITLDLGDFREELKGTRLAGRIKEGALVPYANHQEIIEGRPDTEILAWMDPNELLFLQIQGSGKLAILKDNTTEILRVGYAAQNGHEYVAVGRTLVKDHGIPLQEISMQSIQQWLNDAPPNQAAAVRYSNPSYVFFTPLDNLPEPSLGPLGAQGVQLTPLRSLAVDRDFHGMGAPMWLDIPALEEREGHPFRQLMIAQDTGGAINGAVRGDVYWGSGNQAGEKAGTQDASGSLYILVPVSAAQRLEMPQGAS